jgi:hypothetical protein
VGRAPHFRPVAATSLARIRSRPRACLLSRAPCPTTRKLRPPRGDRTPAPAAGWRSVALTTPITSRSAPLLPRARLSVSSYTSSSRSSAHLSSPEPQAPPRHPLALCPLHRVPFSDCSSITLRLPPLHRLLVLAATVIERYSPIGRFLRCDAMAAGHGPRMAGAPPLPFSPPFPLFASAFLSWSSRAPRWPPPRLAPAGRRAPAPPCRHARRRAQYRTRLAVCWVPPASPLCGEAAGGDLIAGKLTGGKIPAGQASSGVCLTGGVPVDLRPACLSLCARLGALHQVYPVISATSF